MELLSSELAQVFKAKLPTALIDAADELVQLQNEVAELRDKADSIFDLSSMTDEEKKRFNIAMNQKAPKDYQDAFGDVTMRSIFEGRTQRIFAKKKLFLFDANKPIYALYYSKGDYIVCFESLYNVLILPPPIKYTGDWTAKGGDVYSEAYEDLVKKADTELVKKMLGVLNKVFTLEKLPLYIQQLKMVA